MKRVVGTRCPGVSALLWAHPHRCGDLLSGGDSENSGVPRASIVAAGVKIPKVPV